MAVDDATARFLEQFAALEIPPIQELTPAQVRANIAARPPGAPGPDVASVVTRGVPVGGGRLPLRIIKPSERPAGVIVFYHGGGWVLGSIDEHEALARHLAARSGCVVVLPGYRLAPEYRFPTAVEDAWSALQWVAARRAELAGEEAPLIVAGDSAGGNLAAVVAQRAAAAGAPELAMQVLVYPITDCDLNTTSYVDPANQLVLTREAMRWFWDHYAPEETARVHTDASPSRAIDLGRLPPTVVLTAEHDVLRDEGELYATRLMKVGVLVRHRRFAGQIHGFFLMLDLLPAATEAVDFVAAAIRERCAALGAT